MLGRFKRLMRHRWLDERDTHRAIPPEMVERLKRRVAASEQRHSGEIRVYIEAGLPLSYLWRSATARERAVALFGKLRVWDTEHNNGVLIYLLLADRDVEIVADRGIHTRLGQETWEAICRDMEAAFRDGKFEEGVLRGIHAVGEHLARHFPARHGKPDELPNVPVML